MVVFLAFAKARVVKGQEDQASQTAEDKEANEAAKINAHASADGDAKQANDKKNDNTSTTAFHKGPAA